MPHGVVSVPNPVYRYAGRLAGGDEWQRWFPAAEWAFGIGKHRASFQPERLCLGLNKDGRAKIGKTVSVKLALACPMVGSFTPEL